MTARLWLSERNNFSPIGEKDGRNGAFLLKLLFASKLNPVQVIQLDPDSRLLAVVSLTERLPAATIERLQAQYKQVFDRLFGENKWSLVIVEGGARLDFYRFGKEKSTDE